MTLFLTGATGFIGSELTQRLVRDGHRVLALVRSPEKAARLLPAQGVELVPGDLALFSRSNLVLPPCDYVIHLAENLTPASDRWFAEGPLPALQDLIACLERQSWRPRRFLFASSVAAVGPAWTAAPRSEDDEARPVEPYGNSKKRQEDFLRTVTAFPITIFRLPLVFGPETRVMNLFRMAQRGLGFRQLEFNQQNSFVFIDDLLDAFPLLLAEETPGVQLYHLAHPEPYDLDELWKVLGEVVGRRVRVLKAPKVSLYLLAQTFELLRRLGLGNPVFHLRRYRQMTGGHLTLSPHKLQTTLGWTPAYDLRRALKTTYERF